MADGVTITEINITATANTGAAQKNLDRLAHTINRLASATKNLAKLSANISGLVRGLQDVQNVKLDKLAPQMQKVADAMRAFDGLDFKSIAASARMMEAMSRQAEIAYKYQRAATKQAELEERIRNSQRVPQKGGKTSGDTGKNEREKAKAMDKLRERTDAARASLRKFAKTAVMMSPWAMAGKRIAGMVKSLGGFLSAIKRIAVYRAIRFVLKEITQAFKEGTDNLYQYSKAINGQFAQSMDTLATASLYAKNSLAAMASPLINSLAPAIDFIVDKFVDFINTINELIATLAGAETWTRALKYPKEYAEAADGANGSAKKLRATLLGFDEINRLDDNSKGSRGSAAEELDYSKMFTEEQVTSKAKGIIARLKEAFTSGDFYDIGQTLGEKLKEGLSNIPWDSIKERLNKNAMSAASFINGIIDVEGLPDELGHTIAEAFNSMTTKINTFFGNVKWDKVGEFVGDTLSSAVEDIDKQELAQAIKNILSAAFDVALGLIESDPLIGTLALAGIGMKFGKMLGGGMGAGVTSSGLSGSILGCIPKAAVIAVTAVVAFSLGNRIYNTFSDTIDYIADRWNEFWDTDAYHAQANYWAKMNGFSDYYYQKIKEYEQQYQFLANLGYTDRVTQAAIQKKEQMDFYENEDQFLASMGIKADHWYSKMKLVHSMTEEEKKAYDELTKKAFVINFEVKFGKSPKEFIEDGINNLKTSTQPLIDKLKAIGNEFGTEMKTAFISVFKQQEIADSIRERLKNAIPSKIAIDSVSSGLVSIRAYASGGSPAAGSLFIAGESGAELISSSGSGTTVSNRDQIAASVAVGNEAIVAELQEQNSLLRALLDKPSGLTTNSINEAMNRTNLRAGRAVAVLGG